MQKINKYQANNSYKLISLYFYNICAFSFSKSFKESMQSRTSVFIWFKTLKSAS